MILTKNRNQIKNPIGGGVNVFGLVSQTTGSLSFGGVNVFGSVSRATGLLFFGGGNVFWLVSQATGLLFFGGGKCIPVGKSGYRFIVLRWGRRREE